MGRAVAGTMVDAREVTISGARVIPALERPRAVVAAIETFWSATGRAMPPA